MENINTLVQPNEPVEKTEPVESYEKIGGRARDDMANLIAIKALNGLQFTQGLFEKK